MKNLKECSLIIAGIFLISIVSPVFAEKWSRRFIETLPDSAFAVIEITKDGERIRHLPHHDHEGEIDVDHLKSALGRIHQVKWRDPASFIKAKEHLEQHYQVYRQERSKGE